MKLLPPLFASLVLVSLAMAAVPSTNAALMEPLRPKPILLSTGLDIQYSQTAYPGYQLSPAVAGPNGNLIHLGMEWLPFGDLFGKLGVGVGAGVYFVNGIPLETGQKVSLNAYPLRGYLTYRLDYFRHQFLVPFAKIGAGSTFLTQTGVSGLQRFDGYDYGGGVEVCLNKADAGASRDFQREIGVYNTYLVFEFARTASLGSWNRLDLRHDEYRFGLRFEM